MEMALVLAGINGGAIFTFALCLILDEIRIKYCLTDTDMILCVFVFVLFIIGVFWFWFKVSNFVTKRFNLADINKKIEKNHKDDNVKLNKY